MDRDDPLFILAGPRIPHGRVRVGLDRDIKTARTAGAELADGMVAACRTLADQIDQLERWCRRPEARPYDRVPLTGLVRQYADTYAQCFAAAAAAGDPLVRALADFMAADLGPPTPVGDGAFGGTD